MHVVTERVVRVGRGTMGSADRTSRIRIIIVPYSYAIGLRSPRATPGLGRRPQRTSKLDAFSAASDETALKMELQGSVGELDAITTAAMAEVQ
jgi:hypothetical protein